MKKEKIVRKLIILYYVAFKRICGIFILVALFLCPFKRSDHCDINIHI